jgi:hypothetical protein
MPSFQALAPEVVDAVVADLQSGLYGRNEIARRNYIGRATVTGIARDHGLDPSRGNDITATANKARAIQTHERRQQIKEELLGDVERLRVRAWSPWSKEVVTREGIESLHAELPPLPEVQAAYRSIGVALDSYFKLEALDTAGEGSTQQARDFLVDLHDKLTEAREDYETNPRAAEEDTAPGPVTIPGEVVSEGAS